MHIDWATLGAIAVVAAGAALTVVLLLACALVGWSARTRQPDDGAASRVQAGAGTAVAGLCLLAAVLIVGYGLYLIVA